MTVSLQDWQKFDGQWIIGVDEVGRGCLAGPVYAAAVAFKVSEDTSVYKDSKSISAKKRETLTEQIKQNHYFSTASASVEEIDEINIFKASLLAMRRAVESLKLPKGWREDAAVVVDGKYTIPGLKVRKQYALIKGDSLCPQIAAASILAKVTRDQLMSALAKDYPVYGFEKHKAYATKAHIQAIEAYGPCEEHRKSFAPIKQMLQGFQ